jgi:voltage-gated potassium channel
VGYGDVYPITVGGKVFASIISLIGIGIVAIPTGIISASFVEEINAVRRGKK